MTIKNELSIKENKFKTSWIIADRWFRILEFSLILGILHYFEKTTNSIPIKIIYWISLAFLWGWFEDVGQFIAEAISTKKKLTKWKKRFIWLICIILVMSVYLLVNFVTDSITKKQYS